MSYFAIDYFDVAFSMPPIIIHDFRHLSHTDFRSTVHLEYKVPVT